MTSRISRSLADWLPTILALVLDERDARGAGLQVLEQAGPDATLESCPAPLLAGALGQHSRQFDRAGSLCPAERLALVLVRAAGLSDERAAEVAGLTVPELRERLASAEAALAVSPYPRAVLLEDHGLTRQSLVEQCRFNGLEVVAATDSGMVAVAAAAAFAPALAIVDIDLHGAELAGDLAAMQIREAAPHCHVLFVTGYPDADRIAELMQNASALIKPFRPAEFSSAIRAVI